MPTAEDRDRRAADLRGRAALVRANGWADYENVWSSGEVAGVRAVLGEPGALDEAVPVWAPTLWGTDAAEVDGRSGYRATRWWFASVTTPPQLELTETEQARYRAARAASEDLRSALDSGDAEGRSAAFRQLMQTLSTMDADETRDKLHVPDDAGDHEDGLIAIMRRIPDGWGRWISCSRGWYPIIVELDQRLAAIDPGYAVHQCKEKFGGLRYYVHTGLGDEVRDRMWALIRAAEEQCACTCELCGEPGARHVNGRSWLKTLCSDCATAQGYERIGELVNDLTADHRGIWKVTDYAGVESYWDMSRGEVSIVGGERHRNVEVLALPSVLRSWRLRLADGSEITSEMAAAIERVR
ncbi:hypothetical protein D2E70_16125 [Mycobacteroides abscessus]|uniref:hypothetical protein n=1 Tax=Mycobacteroides abscessus TaxID=36809 RepID=UPI000E67DF6F|nr:hypothetical protein [Mycobacteroides abscessus]RIS02732.1 hypothetical protein D2E45_12175 [Mycobacteroides abscessus]RIS67501.1 hypothetical protein D2E70_16125 [Mycobacteroides abscessus]